MVMYDCRAIVGQYYLYRGCWKLSAKTNLRRLMFIHDCITCVCHGSGKYALNLAMIYWTRLLKHANVRQAKAS